MRFVKPYSVGAKNRRGFIRHTRGAQRYATPYGYGGTHMAQSVKRCATCGEFFAPRTKKQSFCDSACYRIFQKRKLKGIHVGVCEVCSKPFTTRQHRRFCGDKCRATHHSEKVFHAEICAECGKSFSSSTYKKKFCCRECRHTNNKRRNLNGNEERNARVS